MRSSTSWPARCASVGRAGATTPPHRPRSCDLSSARRRTRSIARGRGPRDAAQRRIVEQRHDRVAQRGGILAPRRADPFRRERRLPESPRPASLRPGRRTRARRAAPSPCLLRATQTGHVCRGEQLIRVGAISREMHDVGQPARSYLALYVGAQRTVADHQRHGRRHAL